MLSKYLKEGMNFRCHVTDLPHFTNEAPAGQLGELRALPKVTGLGPQGELALPSPLLPVPREGDQPQAPGTGTPPRPSCLLCVFPVYTEFQPRIAEEKNIAPPEPWKLFQWVCPWKNSSDLRVGR